MAKSVLLLGATGSIGTQTIDILQLFQNDFILAGVSAYGKNLDKLQNLLNGFAPLFIHVFDEVALTKAKEIFPKAKFYSGEEGLRRIVDESGADLVVNAVPGEVGAIPSMEAVALGKKLLLANKESLVVSGEKLMEMKKKTGAEIIPLDSEASAIWQILMGKNIEEVEKIYLTCSGGPFRSKENWPVEKLKSVTPEEALAHPKWNMGPKITIDSATLMNKAFEIIEICRLFELPPEKIEVVIHPEAIIHSAVGFRDGQILAHMGKPDMRLIIAFGLFEGKKRPALPMEKFSFFGSTLTFEKPDEERFPSLRFSREALRSGEKACGELCRRNDRAVARFLGGEIGFLDIFQAVEETKRVMES